MGYAPSIDSEFCNEMECRHCPFLQDCDHSDRVVIREAIAVLLKQYKQEQKNKKKKKISKK